MDSMGPLVQKAYDHAEEARSEYEAFVEDVARKGFDKLCPLDPMYCGGRIPYRGLMGNALTWTDCPHAETDCPHKAARLQGDRATRLRELGFGEEARWPTHERIPTDLKTAVKAYCDTFAERLKQGHGLTIGGNVGAGKTCCLAWIATAIMPGADELRRGVSGKLRIIYTSALKLFNVLHRNEGNMGAMTCDLLLLDDLGTEYPSPFALSQFHEVMDERWANRRSTVVTTNRTKEDLGADASIGRIFDRLKQRNPYVATAAASQREEAKVSDWTEESNE